MLDAEAGLLRQSASRQHRGTRIRVVCTVCGQVRNVSSIRLWALRPLGIFKTACKRRGYANKVGWIFVARIAKIERTPCAHDLEELRKPQQRLLRLVDGQIFHSLQQVRRDVLVEELPCRASVRDRLLRFDCYWRWRNRAGSGCACSGCRCGCYCDWRHGRCVFGRLRWRNSIRESWLYCAESGLKALLAAVSRRELW
jgi:hypothetical protein